MPDLILRRNLAEPTFALNIALRGVVDTETTEAIAAEILWRWEDEPDMKPQLLGKVTAGNELAVPFEPLQGREIRLYSIAKTAKGDQDAFDIKSASQKRFGASGVAEISAIAYDDTPNEVTGDIANNGGTGTIRVFRKQGSGGDFVQIQTLAYTATEFVDEPPSDETYYYKLTQDGQTGESSTLSVVVDNAGSTTGSAPTGLSAFYSDSPRQVELAWTNNGGTGQNIIERKVGHGAWNTIDSVADTVDEYDDTFLFNHLNQFYTYRVSNESATGFSNEVSVYVSGGEY